MSSLSIVHFLPGWLQLVFFVYWVVAVVLLIMDDREPSITMAWLFILVLLPLIGMFFYILFGRDWKVVAQRHVHRQTADARDAFAANLHRALVGGAFVDAGRFRVRRQHGEFGVQ